MATRTRFLTSQVGYRTWLTRRIVSDGLTYFVLGTAGLVATGPMVYLLATSLKQTFSPVVDLTVFWHPTFINYYNAWFNQPFSRWVINSVIVATLVTVLNLFVDSFAGFAFAKMRFRGRDAIFIALLSTLMVPVPVTLLPTYILADRLQLLDSYQALILPALAYPVGVFLMRQFIQTIPSELLDAARIDGMSEFGIYVRVILPLSIPGLAVLGLFLFMTQWASLLWPLVVALSDNTRTVQPGLATIPGEYNTDWGLLCAATIMSTIPMLIVFLAFQRYLFAGIVGGRTLKG